MGINYNSGNEKENNVRKKRLKKNLLCHQLIRLTKRNAKKRDQKKFFLNMSMVNSLFEYVQNVLFQIKRYWASTFRLAVPVLVWLLTVCPFDLICNVTRAQLILPWSDAFACRTRLCAARWAWLHVVRRFWVPGLKCTAWNVRNAWIVQSLLKDVRRRRFCIWFKMCELANKHAFPPSDWSNRFNL